MNKRATDSRLIRNEEKLPRLVASTEGAVRVGTAFCLRMLREVKKKPRKLICSRGFFRLLRTIPQSSGAQERTRTPNYTN
jgi:hypothetical protein